MDLVEALKKVNTALDYVLPWLAVILVLRENIRFYKSSRKKISEKKMETREFVQQFLILIFVEIIIGLIFEIIPLFIFKLNGLSWVRDSLRWAIFTGIAFFIIYVYGHENGESRWWASTTGHLVVLILGYMIGRWVGILFFSFPIFALYYSALYKQAMVILPTSNPKDREERFKRFIILAAYTWGIQFPILVVAEHAWKKPEVRIPGDFTRDFKVPGLVWTKSHQVAAITGGAQFKRIDGPGVVFTGKLERPLQIIDLRLQIRNNEIDVISKDGIPFKARVFAAFRMDPDTWNDDTYENLRRLNPLLRGAKQPSYTKGSFHFSHLRIQAAIGTTGSKATPGDDVVYWDQWVLRVVENEARKILSQKMLDELWRPQNDHNLANALDEIAKELKGNVEATLRSAGILIVASRVVNFRFIEDEKELEKSIPRQQIESWKAEWERKRANILDEAKAESDKMQQEARAYAESLLLNSIAEGIARTKEIHPQLPRYVIAMRFLSSLEDFIHKKPGTENGETDKKIVELQTQIREWQDQFFPRNKQDKGK